MKTEKELRDLANDPHAQHTNFGDDWQDHLSAALSLLDESRAALVRLREACLPVEEGLRRLDCHLDGWRFVHDPDHPEREALVALDDAISILASAFAATPADLAEALVATKLEEAEAALARAEQRAEAAELALTGLREAGERFRRHHVQEMGPELPGSDRVPIEVLRFAEAIDAKGAIDLADSQRREWMAKGAEEVAKMLWQVGEARPSRAASAMAAELRGGK